MVYAANPNLIYMQTTAMGESLYLALFIWSVVYFGEFVRGNARALTKCGLCLAAACLTRYDGWFLAAAMAGTVLLFSSLLLTSLLRRESEKQIFAIRISRAASREVRSDRGGRAGTLARL